MSITDVVGRILHHHPTPEPACWACARGTPGTALCTRCQAKVAEIVAFDVRVIGTSLTRHEGLTDFHHLDHKRDERSTSDTPGGGPDQWI